MLQLIPTLNATGCSFVNDLGNTLNDILRARLLSASKVAAEVREKDRTGQCCCVSTIKKELPESRPSLLALNFFN